MRLTKHHGLANDFLILLDPDGSHPLDPHVARALCDRRTGIGADGLIRATPALGEDAVARMELRNADGSTAEMSGNGVRCLAQALLRNGSIAGPVVPIRTDAGLRTVTVHAQLDEVTDELSVDMGSPRIDGAAPEWTGGSVERAVWVDVGNPHLVLELTAAAPANVDAELLELGEWVNAKVTGGANVHLLRSTADGGIAVRTYERGVGPTQACGTGACASAVAARAWGLVGDVVAVEQPGGTAGVTIGDAVVLRGPATFVATVELPGAWPWH
ncbi:MAG TPA: diaminopimelate epimerase [Acidimicrobiales bacterium]|nr:diaminopimelate epimerase [Acidimicrobiales bacterium]